MIDKKDDIIWNFDNSYAQLPKIFYSHLKPMPVKAPKVSIINNKLAKELGLDAHALEHKNGLEILGGNYIPKDAFPVAQAYAGHQFGHFTMLGDGRAILLGEQITPSGERVDIQLKGSGRTPYSRGGDGRATLGPMLREYIISEAMYGLGIPTTRSLAVVTTGEDVIRETVLPGAILTRVAASHLRVGTFEYAARWGSVDDLRALADYTLERHFPDYKSEENKYLYLLKEVIKRQAQLITKWQMVGFIHGVMNTDNMTISGESIDYGPCAFMDTYNPLTVFSSIDRQGRYAYGNQPHIGGWNLSRLAETLVPLLHIDEDEGLILAQDAITEYGELYEKYWLSGMRAKLGLFNEEVEDKELIENLLITMEKYKVDFTNTFRGLTLNKIERTALFDKEDFSQWLVMWDKRRSRQKESKEDSYKLMKRNNPSVIPRNHRVEEALEAAVNNGDSSVMERLLEVLSKPYDYTEEQEAYTTLPDASCSSYRTFCGT